MAFNGLRRGLSDSESRTARRKPRPSRRGQIGLERLEVRLVLSTSTWSGLGGDANWMTPGNWDTVPASGSDLIFPAGAQQLANTDNFPAGTSFGSLTITGSGYSISASSGSTASFTSIDSSATGSNSVNLPIPLLAATTVTVDNSGGSLALGGVISGAFGLTTAGSGTLDLTADNTYTGATTVGAGTLLVDGTQTASAVTIDSGATLGGIGTVGSVTGTGGTVTPGNPAPGKLTDAGALALGPDTNSVNSSFGVVLNGTNAGSGSSGYSQLLAGGAIGLNGVNLVASLGTGFVPPLGSTYTILDNTGTSPISGTFNGQAEGSILQISGTPFKISYVGGTSKNSVVLTAMDPTTTTVSSASTPAPPVFGQSVSLTATVMGPSGSSTKPTGSVQFFNNSTSLGTIALANGTATLDVSSLPVAANSITAEYLGDTNFAASTSTPPTTVTVGKAASSTTLIPATTTPVFGQAIELSATVLAVSPGAGVPTGTVQFFNGTTSLGTATLASGVGSVQVTTLALGSNSITVTYSGDSNFTGQTTSPTILTVGQASTNAVVTTTPASPVFGQSVALTATISAAPPGAGTPTGTVQFFLGTTSLGTGTITAGAATINTSLLAAGNNSITTTYSGDTDFVAGTSTGNIVTIAQASTTTGLTVSNATPSAGESVTFTATVAAVSPGVGTATGTVEFLNGGSSIGTATLSAGKATFTTTLPIAANSITAQYSGDTNFSTSTSTAVTVSVGSANDQFLNQVFLIELNRPITAAELPYWNQQFTDGRSRQSIVSQIATGREARFQNVQDSFNTYLGESGTPGQVYGAVKTAQLTNTSVQAAILGSHNFFEASGGTFTSYFQSLMTAVFGTTFPVPFIERQLSDGVSPIKVAEELLQSNLGKQTQLITSYNTVLQRDPTQPEVVLYVTQMNDDSVLLRQIVVTLLASPEFFTKATTPATST